jgi:hypothetical protein
MYDTSKILTPLIIFLVVVSSPFIVNGGRTPKKLSLSLDTPVIAKLKEKTCVEPKAWMRRRHMRLLGEWRKQKVREGKVFYANSQGKTYKISLSKGCLNCHSNKKEFCDRCHASLNVSLKCFTCHKEPEKATKWVKTAGYF